MSTHNDLPPPPGPVNIPPPNSADGSPPAAGTLHIGSILKRMAAHLPMALVVMVLGVSITMVVARSRKPTYASETVIYYSEGIGRAYTGVEGGGDDLKALPARLKETLLARANLERIIKEFNLYPQIVMTEGTVAAVDKFRTKIAFKARSAETFQIGFEGTTADEAQQVTARLADVIIEDMNDRKTAQAKTTTEFLEAEKKRADEELDKREMELARFVATHSEFANENNPELAGSGVRAVKTLGGDDPALLALERQRTRLREAVALNGIPVAKGGVAAPAAGPDPLFVNRKTAAENELAAAQKDVDDKSEKLKDEHPDMKAARTRLAAAQAKLHDAVLALQAATPGTPQAQGAEPEEGLYDGAPKIDERTRLQRALAENDREVAARKQGVKNGGGSANDVAERIISLETKWKQLNRERAKARQRQTDVEERLFRARSTRAVDAAGEGSQVRVLDPAFFPVQASSLSKGKVVLIGILVSVLAGLLVAAAWGVLLDDRVFSAEDLTALAPALVTVPKSLLRSRKKPA